MSLWILFVTWLLLLLPFCGSANIMDRKLSSSSSSNNSTDNSTIKPESRIIGGFNATEGRFPYYVSLRLDIPTCGGVLIAPDIVLTAAHCWLGPTVSYLVQVGRYNADDPLDDYEQFVATQYIPDPYYGIEATFSHDVMILVLNGTSSKPPITINRNATIPLPNQSLTIIGLGSINPSVTVLPPILQEVNVDVVINSVCEQAHDNMNDTYQGQITSDMICASNPGKDSCNGDSGGPLVLSDITNDTAATDILVGLASWGESPCANPIFPGVYSRMSALIDFINANVCRHSQNPPLSFPCKPVTNTFSPAPSQVTTTFPSKTIPITVNIVFSSDASQTWWFILNSRGETAYIVPRFTYEPGQTNIHQQVDLPAGQSYTFVIKSETGMGMYGGRYLVRLGRPSKPGAILAAGDGSSFAYEQRTNFTLTSTFTGAPTLAPSRSQAPSISLAPTPLQQTITLTIDFDDGFSSDIGYYILNEAGTTVVNVTFGTFSNQATAQENYHLSSGRNYTFVIQSQSAIGLYPGNYSLALGAPGEGGPLLYFSNGTFSSEQKFSFFLPRSFTAVPSSSPSEPPTLVPTVTASPTTPVQIVTLIINFNSLGSEIGYTFTNGNGKTVVNVPFGTFSNSDVTATEVYHLHSEQMYTFTIQNSNFDGLFPGNYTILLGPPNGGGPILVFSTGFFAYEETRTFYLAAAQTPSIKPQGTIPTFAPVTNLPPITPTESPSQITAAPVSTAPSPSPTNRTPKPTPYRQTPRPSPAGNKNLMLPKTPKVIPTLAKKTKVIDKSKNSRKAKADTKEIKGVKRGKGHAIGLPKVSPKGPSTPFS